MTLLRNTILIEAALDQKQEFKFANGVTFHIVPNRHLYEQNAREVSPVVGLVKAVGYGVETSLIGKYVVIHHNLIFNPEYLVKTENGINTSVIPNDRWVMGWIDEDGDLRPLNKNVICERIDVPVNDMVTDAAKKTEENLMQVLHSGMEHICRNDTIIVYKYADYEVVYQWNDVVRRQIVVTNKDVLGTFQRASHNKYGFDSAGKSYVIERVNYIIMRPLKDRVIVKPDAPPEESTSGFVVPGMADIKVLQGTIIAVGQGERATATGELIPMETKAGDVCVYGKNAGTKVTIDGEEYLVMFEREILSVI